MAIPEYQAWQRLGSAINPWQWGSCIAASLHPCREYGILQGQGSKRASAASAGPFSVKLQTEGWFVDLAFAVFSAFGPFSSFWKLDAEQISSWDQVYDRVAVWTWVWTRPPYACEVVMESSFVPFPPFGYWLLAIGFWLLAFGFPWLSLSQTDAFPNKQGIQ